jgi:hypothetical protein
MRNGFHTATIDPCTNNGARGMKIKRIDITSRGRPSAIMAMLPVHAVARARARPTMPQKLTRWMASDTTENSRIEYGPFATSLEAEIVARRAGFPYLLKYDMQMNEDDELLDVTLVIIELPDVVKPSGLLHTRCASCGESATHTKVRQAELWADIHEFEHLRHKVRFFVHTRREGLVEIGAWRKP